MKAVLLTLLFVSIAVPAALADDASKTAKIEEIFTLTKVDQMQAQMTNQMKAMMQQQIANMQMSGADKEKAEQMQTEILTYVQTKLSWANMKPEFVKLYADTFTEPELDGMLTFYKSPAGQAMLEKMPQLMGKTMGFVQQQLGAITPEINRIAEKYKTPAAK